MASKAVFKIIKVGTGMGLSTSPSSEESRYENDMRCLRNSMKRLHRYLIKYDGKNNDRNILIHKKLEELDEQVKDLTTDVISSLDREELTEKEQQIIKDKELYDEMQKKFMPYMLLYQLASSSSEHRT